MRAGKPTKIVIWTIFALFITGMGIFQSAPAYARSADNGMKACEMALRKRIAAIAILQDEEPILRTELEPDQGHVVLASLPSTKDSSYAESQSLTSPRSTDVQKSESLAVATSLYSDAMIVDALRDVLAAAPDVPIAQIRAKAISQYKIDGNVFDRAVYLFNPETARDPISGYTDAQVFSAIRESVAQNPNIGLEQIRDKAKAAFKITGAQFDRAARSLNRGAQAGHVILSLGDGWIGGDNRRVFTEALAGSTGLQVNNRATGGQKIKDIFDHLDADIQSAGGVSALGAVVIHAGGQDFLDHIKDKMTGKSAQGTYLDTVSQLDRLVARLVEMGLPVVISPAPMLSASMIVSDPNDPTRLSFKREIQFVPDPMYKAIAARYPNVTVAGGYTVASMLAEGKHLSGGLFPDETATDRLAVSLGQSVRVATSY